MSGNGEYVLIAVLQGNVTMTRFNYKEAAVDASRFLQKLNIILDFEIIHDPPK